MSVTKMGLQAAINAANASAQAIEQNESHRAPMQQVELSKVSPSPYQARREFDRLEELAEDIRAHGVLQPVLVRPVQGGRFELVAGERRWRASKLAGKELIPAVVRRMSDEEARLFSLRENLQREDLNAYEIAQAVVELAAIEAGEPTAVLTEALGGRQPNEEILHATEKALGLLGKELTLRTFQRHYVPLLHLPERLLQALEEGVSYSAVLKLRGASDEQLDTWLPLLKSGEWGRRDLEDALREARATKVREEPHTRHDWGNEAAKVRALVTEERLRNLDKQKQAKAQRLLEQLLKLIEESEK